MDRETLYKFFEGAASYEEEVRIRQWNIPRKTDENS